MNALLIGCGNIGALYDYYSDEIHTHAKAFQHYGYRVDYIEPNDKIAKKVKSKYGYKRKTFNDTVLNKYDIVSICTPTDSHYRYLREAIKEEVPVVICEKPVAYNIKELDSIVSQYKIGKTKVLVNYIRRFQTQYTWLKNEIENIGEPLQSIHCSYHKGILNSASHALDTIQYLTSFELNDASVFELNRFYDFFEKDPTVSFTGYQNGLSYFCNGLNINYPIFEIDLFFTYYRISLRNGGEELSIFKDGELKLFKSGMTKNYMIDVLKKSEELFYNRELNDNLKESISLNKALIKIINK